MKAQKSFNFAQRNEILIKEYHHQDKKEARNFTPKVKKIQLTTDSPTYKKIVHEFKLGGYNNQSQDKKVHHQKALTPTRLTNNSSKNKKK